MITIYQFLTSPVCSSSNLTWSLFHLFWDIDYFPWSCFWVYHSSWHSLVCRQTQYAMGQFWPLLDGTALHSFLQPIMMQCSHLCVLFSGPISSMYSFGKYKIFCRPDEAMLFVTVRTCHWRTFFSLHMLTNKSAKLTFTWGVLHKQNLKILQ